MSLGVEILTGNGTFLGMSPRRMSDAGTGDGDVESGNIKRKYLVFKAEQFLAQIFHAPVLIERHFSHF